MRTTDAEAHFWGGSRVSTVRLRDGRGARILTSMPDLATILGFALVGLVFAVAARLYLRDARDRRAGLGDGAFAWRRSPNTIRPAAAEPVLQVLPRRWGWQHLVIAAVQVTAIGGLTYGMIDDMGPDHAAGFMVMNIIIVAFGTAVLTRLWDLSWAGLARRRTGARQGHQAGGEGGRVLAPRRRLGEGA